MALGQQGSKGQLEYFSLKVDGSNWYKIEQDTMKINKF